MKKELTHKITDNEIIFYHRKKQKIVFSEYSTLVYVGKRFTIQDKLNVICVSRKIYSKCKHDKFLLFTPSTNSYLSVTLVADQKLSENEFMSTTYVKDQLNLSDGDSVFFCTFDSRTYNQIYTQTVENIRENNLVISAFDRDDQEINLKNFKHYEIYNSFSGDSLIIKASHIIIDPALPAGTVRLNRKQRIFLGLELPLYLSDEQWAILSSELEPEQMDLIHEVYGSTDYILNDNVPYDKKQKCQKIIQSYFGNQIKMIPVLETLSKNKKGIIKKFCDFYVGKSTISLIAKRPFENDEGLDIIRMTPSNMNLLGIDEMDKVILQYENRKISCRVLALDNEDAFLKTNRPVFTDLVVGIPIHIRKKLGIHDLSSAIKIDRDTVFIFKKSINEQVVPIILTLFSANLFSDSSIVISAVLSLISIPLVLYFNLSSKRNMRA